MTCLAGFLSGSEAAAVGASTPSSCNLCWHGSIKLRGGPAGLLRLDKQGGMVVPPCLQALLPCTVPSQACCRRAMLLYFYSLAACSVTS